jgi:uncharacterized protein (TIRG00374 family)
MTGDHSSRYDRRKVARIAFGFLITVSLVTLIVARVDLREMRQAFDKLSFGVVAWGLVALAVGYAVRIWRWYWMLMGLGAQVSYGECARAFLVGNAVNNLLPLRAGDAARVIGLGREINFPMTKILGTLIVERLLDVGVLLTLLFLVLLGLPANVLPSWVLRSSEWLTGAFVVVAISVLVLPYAAERLSEKFIAPISPGAGRIVRHILVSFTALARPQMILALLGYSFVAWFMEGLLYIAFVMAADGGEPVVSGLTTFALGTLSTLIPSGPGYVGTFDVFALIGLRTFGMDINTAAVVAVGVHATLWFATTAAGGLAFAFGGLGFRRRSGDDKGHS